MDQDPAMVGRREDRLAAIGGVAGLVLGLVVGETTNIAFGTEVGGSTGRISFDVAISGAGLAIGEY